MIIPEKINSFLIQPSLKPSFKQPHLGFMQLPYYRLCNVTVHITEYKSASPDNQASRHIFQNVSYHFTQAICRFLYQSSLIKTAPSYSQWLKCNNQIVPLLNYTPSNAAWKKQCPPAGRRKHSHMQDKRAYY